jgi:hypothetical protein
LSASGDRITGETSLSPPADILSRSPLNASQSASPQSTRNDSKACEWSESADGAAFSASVTSTHYNPKRNSKIGIGIEQLRTPSCGRIRYLGREIEGGEADEGAIAGDLVDDEVRVAVLEDAAEAREGGGEAGYARLRLCE